MRVFIGALWMTKETSFVSPFLFHVSRSEMTGPLTHFQSTVFTKRDVKALIRTLNRACGEYALSGDEFDGVFEAYYPALEKELLDIRAPEGRQNGHVELPEELLRVLRKYVPIPGEDTEGRS